MVWEYSKRGEEVFHILTFSSSDAVIVLDMLFPHGNIKRCWGVRTHDILDLEPSTSILLTSHNQQKCVSLPSHFSLNGCIPHAPTLREWWWNGAVGIDLYTADLTTKSAEVSWSQLRLCACTKRHKCGAVTRAPVIGQHLGYINRYNHL